jgi:hypothetical protein
MMHYVLSSAMALALIAGVSHAQDTSVNRSTTVVTEPDGDRDVRTHTTVNRDGPYGDHSVTTNTNRRVDEDGDSSTTRRTTRTNETPYGDSRSTTTQRTTTDPDR